MGNRIACAISGTSVNRDTFGCLFLSVVRLSCPTKSLYSFLNLWHKLKLDSMSTPRGIRNNNPLNIRKNGTKWEGLRPIQNDNSFFQFRTMAYGYRAGIKTIHTYFNKYGLRSIRRIIHRWAPPCENDTENYIKVVSERSGISPDAEIDIYNLQQMMAIVSAMSYMENGVEPYPEDVYMGYLMAFAL